MTPPVATNLKEKFLLDIAARIDKIDGKPGAAVDEIARVQKIENGFGVQSSGDYSHAEGINHDNTWFSEVDVDVVEIDGKYYLNITPTSSGIYSYNIDGFLLYLHDTISGNISKSTGYYFCFREDFDNDFAIKTGVTLTFDPNKLIAAKVLSSTPTPYNFTFDKNVVIFGSVAASSGSHCEGFSTSALNTYSHSEGYRSVSTGHGAHAEGFHTMAVGRGAHTEGAYSRAGGSYAHASGSKTVASGDSSHAEGYKTKASGKHSHAEGESTESKHVASHAEGLGTKTSSDHQHVCGQYNCDNANALLIIGNGADDANRMNAFEVLKNGAVYANGVNLLDAIYNTYPTDTNNGAVAVYTDSGAGSIPMKSVVVQRDQSVEASHQYITIRRLGKNLFNPNKDLFVSGYIINDAGNVVTSASSAYSRDYLPVIPGTDYVFSGSIVHATTKNHVAYYDKNKAFISRQSSESGVPLQFKTPDNCFFIRYVIYNGKVNSLAKNKAMLEVGKIASDYEEYASTDYTIDFGSPVRYVNADMLFGSGELADGSSATCTTATPSTLYGKNYFYVVNGTRENDSSSDITTINAVFRIDPTMAYNRLRYDSALVGISITTQPTKTVYSPGESFDPTGMVVTALYENGTTKTVTGYVWSPNTIESEENSDGVQITISYTEGNYTKATTLHVDVNE